MFPGSSRFGAGIVDNSNAFSTSSTVQHQEKPLLLPIKRASTTGGILDKAGRTGSTFSGILSKAVGLTGRSLVSTETSRMPPRTSVMSPTSISPSRSLSPSRIFSPPRELSPTRSVSPTGKFFPTREVPPSRMFSPKKELSTPQVLSPTRELPGSKMLSMTRDKVFPPTKECPSQRIFSPTNKFSTSRMLSPMKEYSATRLLSPSREYSANKIMSSSKYMRPPSLTSNRSYLHSRSPSPISSSSRSYSLTSTETNFPRRVFPQTSAKIDHSDELEGKEDAPVVFDAGMSFVMGVKNQAIRQQFKPKAAHLQSSTASSALSSKIKDFLCRTDHVMEEWKRLGKQDTDMQSLATLTDRNGGDSYTGRSRSATNILIKGFQLYSKTNSASIRSPSIARVSEGETVSEIDEVKSCRQRG